MPRIPRAIIDELVAHARAELPNEACGMVHAAQGVPVAVHRVGNQAASPYRYEMNPVQLLRLEQQREASGETLFAIYHSHVASPARPSPTDVRMAFFPPGAVAQPPMYPDAFYIVVSLADEAADVRAFRIHSAATIDEAVQAIEEAPIEAV